MKRIILSIALIVVLFAASMVDKVQPVEAQGCEAADCEYVLQVCNERGCYWITDCVGGFFIEALCSPIRNGCQFESCGWEPIFTKKERRLPKVSEPLIDKAAAIDPFAAMGLSTFDGVPFKGEKKFKFVAYQFPSTEAAKEYLKESTAGIFTTQLQAPVHWSERLQKVQPDTEVVTLRSETPSENVTLLHVTHGSTILTVKYKLKGGEYRARLKNNS